MFVTHLFKLDPYAKEQLYSWEPNFGFNGYGEFLFYRTYSRIKDFDTGEMESWHDVVLRVVEGTFSIRKDWYIKNHIAWDEKYWQDYAIGFMKFLFDMKWFPAGRGLWMMGTQFVYKFGSMCLSNCGATYIEDDIGSDLHWATDALMLGVGVGFEPKRNDNLKLYHPKGTEDFVVEDSREGWIDSIKAKCDSYTHPNRKKIRLITDKVRGPGLPIKAFGGISSGPQPLIVYHEQLTSFFERYQESKEYDSVRLKADCANGTGTMVVSGNVRRSAELLKGKVRDKTFLNLKNYDLHPDRAEIGWISNNSVEMETPEDFECLGEVASRVVMNGEPGVLNRINMRMARVGKDDLIKYLLREDPGDLMNPCQIGLAKVLTPKGIRCFSDLNIGDLILGDNQWVRITNKWSTGINEVYKYKTTANIFYGTNNHKVCCEGFKVTVKNAYGIDVALGPNIVVKERNPQAILDGLVIGDGVVHHSKVNLYIGINDQDLFSSEIKTLINETYGKNTEYKVNTTIQCEELPVTYLRIIPERYLKADHDTVCAFLSGLFTANGSICGNRVTLKAVSLQLIEEVQMMLSSVGIKSYITTNKEKEVEFINGTYLCKQSYDLQFAEGREIFYSKIKFLQKYKMVKLKTLIDTVKPSNKYKETYDIIEINYLGKEETFDITVDSERHVYWTQGCLVSNCAEQILENKELCLVPPAYPTKCEDTKEWLQACEYATFYGTTCQLLPTHRPETNRISAKNRRIGVSFADYSAWKLRDGVHNVTRAMREGYKRVRTVGKQLSEEAGVPEPIRITTVTPGGTIPKLPGIRSAIGHPTFIYTLRRTRLAENSDMHKLLEVNGIKCVKDYYSANTVVCEWPIYQGYEVNETVVNSDGVPETIHKKLKSAESVSLWEQAINLIHVQREWSDNAVSNTLYFRPKWKLIKHMFADNDPLASSMDNNIWKDLENHTHVYGIENYIAFKMQVNDEAKTIIINDKKKRDQERFKFIIKYSEEIEGDISELKIYEFDPNHEEDDVEPVLSAIVPHIKSLSLLPHTPEGVYIQMPEEKLSKEEYDLRVSQLKKIDWSTLRYNQGSDEKYCSGDNCEIGPVVTK